MYVEYCSYHEDFGGIFGNVGITRTVFQREFIFSRMLFILSVRNNRNIALNHSVYSRCYTSLVRLKYVSGGVILFLHDFSSDKVDGLIEIKYPCEYSVLVESDKWR